MDSNRQAIIVCESVHHGNTRRIAEAMAGILNAKIVTPVELTDPGKLAEYALVGFGSGIYFGRPHRSLRTLVNRIGELPTDVFLFSTAGLPRLSPLWHAGLRRTLVRKGARILGEFACRGWDTVGPFVLVGGLNRRHPNASDISRAEAFAKQILQRNQTWGVRVENSSLGTR